MILNPPHRKALSNTTIAFLIGCTSWSLCPVQAATFSSRATAPVVDSTDIANLATSTGADKWFFQTSNEANPSDAAKGQTFTVGPNPVRFNALTYKISGTNLKGATTANPTTWTIRLGTLSGTNFTQIASETAQQTANTGEGHFITWTFTTPVALSPNTTYAVDVGMRSRTAFGTGIPYLSFSGNVSTPRVGTYYDSGDLGVGAATVTLTTGRDRLFHVDLRDPINPMPVPGAIVPAGNVALSWQNLTPTTGTNVWVDVWFGTSPTALTKIVGAGLNAATTTVSAPIAGTYHWRIDSYLAGVSTGTPTQGTLFNFIVNDTDGDGFLDSYELANTTPPSATALNRDDDIDTDGLTNWQEFQLGTIPSNPDTDGDTLLDGPERTGVGSRPATNPTRADTDSDGLSDLVETNTRSWVSASNTGTSPVLTDTDTDGLTDGVETNTRVFLSTSNTGTDPLDSDTDNDNAGDWYEVIIIDRNPALTGQPNSPNTASLKPSVAYPLPAYNTTDAGVTNKPVKVYILSGQSNMLGYGTVAGTGIGTLNRMVNTENKFPHLRASGGGWVERNDVHVHSLVDVTANQFEKKKLRPDWQANESNRFGPEFGFGTIMGWYHDEPVLLIKPSIGNRALGWDYLPPGTPNHIPTPPDTFTYAGYGLSGPSGSASLERWLTAGGAPGPGTWYAGKQFDDYFHDEEDMGMRAWVSGISYPNGCAVKHNGLPYMSTAAHTSGATNEPGVGASWGSSWRRYNLTNVVDILDNFATQYPAWAAQGFEISGYVWWQGHRDQSSGAVNSRRYRQNMERFIKQIRLYYENRYGSGGGDLTRVKTNAPFVLATLDAGGWDMSGNALTVANGQLAIDGNAQTSGVINYPEFTGNVKTVEARGFFRAAGPSATDGTHYFHNAESYLLVGDALGRAMVELQPAPSNTFAAWMATFPSVAPGVAGFSQDADGDGVDNGAENFFGTNPGVGSAGITAGVRDGNTFIFTHPQNASPASGVSGTYRWSKDLVTFRNGGQTDGDGTSVSFNASTTAGITTVTATVTGTATAKLFVDVRVTQN